MSGLRKILPCSCSVLGIIIPLIYKCIHNSIKFSTNLKKENITCVKQWYTMI